MNVQTSRKIININDGLSKYTRKLIRFLFCDGCPYTTTYSVDLKGIRLAEIVGVEKQNISKYRSLIIRELNSFQLDGKKMFEARYSGSFRIQAGGIDKISNKRSDLVYDFRIVQELKNKYSIFLYESALLADQTEGSFFIPFTQLSDSDIKSTSEFYRRLSPSFKEVSRKTEYKLQIKKSKEGLTVKV